MNQYYFQSTSNNWLTVDPANSKNLDDDVGVVMRMLKSGSIKMIIVTGSKFDPDRSIINAFTERDIQRAKRMSTNTDVSSISIVFLTEFPEPNQEDENYYVEKLKSLFGVLNCNITMISGPKIGRWFYDFDRSNPPEAPLPLLVPMQRDISISNKDIPTTVIRVMSTSTVYQAVVSEERYDLNSEKSKSIGNEIANAVKKSLSQSKIFNKATDAIKVTAFTYKNSKTSGHKCKIMIGYDNDSPEMKEYPKNAPLISYVTRQNHGKLAEMLEKFQRFVFYTFDEKETDKNPEIITEFIGIYSNLLPSDFDVLETTITLYPLQMRNLKTSFKVNIDHQREKIRQ